MKHAPLLAALALSLAASAAARVDLEARRLDLDRPDGTYGRTDVADLALTYRPTGDSTVLRDVRVDVEIRTNPTTRVAFRIREVEVPQGDREFHMSLDMGKLALRDGTYTVLATIDGNDAFGETNEDNNQVRTTLTVGTRAAPTGPTGSTGSRTSAGQMSLNPRSARVVARTTCSAFEREWNAPLEVGWHPGYGHASLVLVLPHPVGELRSGEYVRRGSLRLRGEAVGRPFSELGSLQATIRTMPSANARCGSLPAEARVTLTDFDGDTEVDLTRALAEAEDLSHACASELHVVLSFPESRLEPQGGSLLRLAPGGASLDLTIERR